MIRSPNLLRHHVLGVVFLTACDACGDDGSATGNDGNATSSGSSSVGSESSADTTGDAIECLPNTVRCGGETTLERCAPTGKLWLPEECPGNTACVPCTDDTCTEDRCLGPCDSVDELPSSAGCSFIANRQLHLVPEFNDGLVVANPNTTEEATVQLYLTPEGKNVEEPEGDPVVLAPLESHTFELTTNFVQTQSSAFRTGGTHRVQSDIPIIAYHHAPVRMSLGNDSSLLLPEKALRKDYVIFSYGPNVANVAGEPTYFEIVALENFTTVEWWPSVDTAGDGLPIQFVPQGGRGELKMNRFDTARIAASGMQQEVIPLRDVSGTVVKADKPIWVTSGSKCSRVPTRDLAVYPLGHCDPLQEMPIPLDYWGTDYVAPAAPTRDSERHHWRVYAGKDGVEVYTDPEVVPPFTIDERGDFFEFSVENGRNFEFHSDNGVFMPVQYLQSKIFDETSADKQEPPEESTDVGDPSMYQMVPVEQFLSRYVFVPALNYPDNYVQVIHRVGATDIRIAHGADEDVVDGYVPAGSGYEVSNWYIDPCLMPFDNCTYVIESDDGSDDTDDSFGIIQVGYSGVGIDNNCELPEQYLDENGDPAYPCFSSYAYPGGMKSEAINIP